MKKIVVATLTAASICAAGFAAHADEFTLDLTKINPHTEKGQQAIRIWKTQVADAYCGPVDMPQPLDLMDYRISCQQAAKADAQARIDAAFARQEAALRHRVVASN